MGGDVRKNAGEIFDGLRRCIRPSYRPMLVKELLDLLIFRKPAFARGLESTIDATQFGRRCDVPTSVKLRVNLQRKLRQLDLSRLGPSLHALQNVLEFLCGHHECIARSFRSSDAQSDVAPNSP